MMLLPRVAPLGKSRYLTLNPGARFQVLIEMPT
jgi:hypothetical protein